MQRDSISDFIIQLKNASLAKKDAVVVSHSNLVFAVASKLAEKGYTKAPVKKGKKIAKFIEVGILYGADGRPRISGVERVSKLSKRVYAGFKDIHSVKQGYGTLVVSTPNGILSDDEARTAKVGGELLFKIW